MALGQRGEGRGLILQQVVAELLMAIGGTNQAAIL
jgi:hypothetical protein